MANRESRLNNTFESLLIQRDDEARVARSLASAADKTFAATVVLGGFGSCAEPRLGTAVAVLGLISTIELHRASRRAERRALATQENMLGALRRLQSELPR